MSVCVVAFLLLYGISGKMQRMRQITLLWIVVFSLYISTVICITLLNRARCGTRQLILNPLSEFQELPVEMRVHLFRGMISNIIMLIPFGMLVSIKLKRHPILGTILSSGICSIAIELAQYVFCRGVSESLDVIFNVLGAVCGAAVAQGILWIGKKRTQKDIA